MIPTKNEINSAIFQPMKNGKRNKPEVKPAIKFNANGSSDENQNNKIKEDECVAMLIPVSNGIEYKVRANRTNGQLYNPFSDGSIKQFDRKTTDARFKFKVVTERAFNHYIKYLKDQNEVDWVLASREG